MADMMETLKGILGDDAEEKVKAVIGGLQSGTESSPSVDLSEAGDYLSQIRSLVSQMGKANDSRSNLLLSLKPYMRAERRSSIDNAVKILNLTRIAGLLK